jgi:hypothetical protein
MASAGLAEIDAVARLPAKRLNLGGEAGGTPTALTGNNVRHFALHLFVCSFARNTGKDASFRDAAKKMSRMKTGHAAEIALTVAAVRPGRHEKTRHGASGGT